jgi:hypothetical protein
MHLLRVTLSITSVEEVEHVLFELLTIPVDVFSRLLRCQINDQHPSEVPFTLSAVGKSTSFARVAKRRSSIAT